MSADQHAPAPFVDEVARLVTLGMSEEVARDAAATARRERLLKNNILTGGCLTLADAMADVHYIMEPALVQRQLLTLTGRTGHGKSTVGIAMAFALALGRELGPLKPRRPGLIYYVSAEDTDGTRKRIYAEAIRHKLTVEERAAIDKRLRWVHVNVTMNPMLIAEHIREDADVQQVSAIFVDTGVALFAGDDDNQNTQMQAFATASRALTEIDGAPCVVLFWHPVKNASADNLVPRGGSALLNAIDGNLTLWLDVESDTATLGHTKWRADIFEPIEFALETFPLIMPSGASSSVKIATPKTGSQLEERESDVASRREKLLGVLVSASPDEPIALRKLAALVGASKSTVSRDLRHMAATKPALIALDPFTDRYAATVGGRKAVHAIRQRETRAYKVASDGE